MTEASPTTHDDRLIAWGLFGASFLALFATQASVGFVRDESVYFAAAESYAGWFRLLLRNPSVAFSDASIVGAYDLNHEHPVLMKNLFGLSFLVFSEWLGLLKPAAAFRVPAFAIAAVIPPIVYLFDKQLYGQKAGLFAAVSFFLVPRQFFNAQLACFDMPVAAMWLTTVYCYWRAQSDRRWWLYCGLAFGLTLASKHNGLFLPFVLGPFALWRSFEQTRASAEARARVWQIVGIFAATALLYALLVVVLGLPAFQEKFLPLSPHVALFVGLSVGCAALLWRLRGESLGAFRALAPIAAMAVLGPAIFYLHWPYLWHHPVDRAAWYLAFHAQHSHYAWMYLGTLLRQPPFPLEYVVVVTALTVPTSLFVPMVVGWLSVAGRGALWFSQKTRALVSAPSLGEVLVLVNAVASIAIISSPSVPHFGGVKHWFPSMPFLAILAGLSVSRAGEALLALVRKSRPKLHEWAVQGPLFALILLPAFIATWRVHPFGTSYYSELAGGLPGAATLGMQRQFWSNNVTGVLEWINQHAPPNARLYLHEVNGYSFRDYQRNGMLRRDLVPAGGPWDAHLAAYQYHQEFKEHEVNMWQAFGTVKPVAGLYLDETPQVVVYQRP
jgi:4-amino-4-deoxy-L-arabinose transferase-like glycosyltransferase